MESLSDAVCQKAKWLKSSFRTFVNKGKNKGRSLPAPVLNYRLVSTSLAPSRMVEEVFLRLLRAVYLDPIYPHVHPSACVSTPGNEVSQPPATASSS
jgi:hypothetical protein